MDHRCSARSEAAHEPLAGTASTIRRWLLVEHAGPWGRTLADARLPDGLGRELEALERRTRARVLLIRRPGRGAEGDGVACFAVDTRDAWLGRTTLDRIADAARLDPADRGAFEPLDRPLVVACTHGRRDPCCAERGRPVAATLAASHPDLVWESTHVGGDRFAGNLVAFPHGLYFGRVEPEEAPSIVGAYAEPAPRIGALERYRGRAAHRLVVQAAETAARRHLDLDRVERLVPTAAGGRAGDRARVTFEDPNVVVDLRRETSAPMRLTCRSEHAEAFTRWHVAAIDGPSP